MKQAIYKIVNTTNGKFYVGSTINTKVRFNSHRRLLRKGTHHCKHLQAAWSLYGEAAFVFLLVQEVAAGDSLQAAEDVWLKEHVGTSGCYNSGYASDAPWRGAPKEAHPQYGRPKTEEHKRKISDALKAVYAADPDSHPRKGAKWTPEQLEKIKAGLHPPKGADHYRYGKTVSADVRKKIGAAQRGVKKAPRTFTPEGLVRAQENMRANAREQVPVDFSAVHAKFPDEVKQRYDFTKAVYTGALVRIEGCSCPTHGVFSQYAAQFRKGRGCPTCGAEQRADSKRAQMKAAWQDPEERAKMLADRAKKG